MVFYVIFGNNSQIMTYFFSVCCETKMCKKKIWKYMKKYLEDIWYFSHNMTGAIREARSLMKRAKHSSATVLMTQLGIFMMNMLKPFHWWPQKPLALKACLQPKVRHAVDCFAFIQSSIFRCNFGACELVMDKKSNTLACVHF